MPASVRDLIDPMSPEYAQGRTAFQAGESYETCPHKPAGKRLSRQRTNWFEGYWDARAKAAPKTDLVRQSKIADIRVAAYTDRDGRILSKPYPQRS